MPYFETVRNPENTEVWVLEKTEQGDYRLATAIQTVSRASTASFGHFPGHNPGPVTPREVGQRFDVNVEHDDDVEDVKQEQGNAANNEGDNEIDDDEDDYDDAEDEDVEQVLSSLEDADDDDDEEER